MSRRKGNFSIKGIIIGIFAAVLAAIGVPQTVFSPQDTDLRPRIEFDKSQYNTDAYCELNNNIPYFTEAEKGKLYAFENYSKLDSLGRCGIAYVNVCLELMPTKPRGEIGSVIPSGWCTTKYAGLVEGNYLYNRCHLVGFQLAGENANKKNLITGTRYLNVEGMLPFENEIADYVHSTGNHVLYRVTPQFTGDNLVADGVQMEAWSVEDDGQGVCFNVFCYNIQPGIVIDYATGKSHRDESYKANTQNDGNEKEARYIFNANSKVFHDPKCPNVNKISKKNKKEYKGTREKLIKQGYTACHNCKP